MSLAGKHLKGDNVLDPEKAMQRDLDKKKVIATRTVEVIKTAFVREYLRDFGELPDLTNPMINMFYNGWLAAQGKREWLSPEDVQELKKRQILNEKRKQTMLANRSKRRGLR
jgi:hypothetical protein